ncbi:restriction endonuclease subunit S [Kroppenstedtia eburnea]
MPEEEQPYELPENWVWVRLGSLSKVTGGGTPKSSVEDYYYNGEIPWITPADLSGYKDKYISRGKRNITKSGLENSSAKLLPENTLLLSSRAPVGYVALAANSLCTNQGFKSFPPTEAYIPDYGYWYLRFAKHIVDEFASGTTFKEVSGSKAAKIPLPLPPLPEQKRIVDRVESLLGKIDEAKELIQEARDSFEQRRAAILDRAFRGELTRTWREQHPDAEPADRLLERIREEKASMETRKGGRRKKAVDLSPINPPYELPQGWKWVRLGELTESTVYGTSAKANDDTTGIPVLRMGNIQRGELESDNLRYLPPDHPDVQKYQLDKDDLLFNRTNSYELVGKTAIVRAQQAGKMTFASYLVRVRLHKKNVLAQYICNYINSAIGREYLLSTVTQQVGQANINATKLIGLPVPVPPEAELKEINATLESVFGLAEQAEEWLEVNLNSLTQSILTQAFRGELGTNDPGEESALELLKRTLAEQNGLAYQSPATEELRVAEQGELYLT